MQSMSMNWTTVGTVHMTLMKMMSFRDALTTSLGSMAESRWKLGNTPKNGDIILLFLLETHPHFRGYSQTIDLYVVCW